MNTSEIRARQPSTVVDLAALLSLVAEARSRMVPALQALVVQLEACSSADAEVDFGALIKASQQLLELDDTDMARLLNVSRPTIGRWIRGQAKPHALARRAIATALIRDARTKLRLLED